MIFIQISLISVIFQRNTEALLLLNSNWQRYVLFTSSLHGSRVAKLTCLSVSTIFFTIFTIMCSK